MKKQLLFLALILQTGFLYPTITGNWLNTTNPPGDWSVSENWSGGVPTSSGDIAMLENGGTSPSSARAVSVDTANTIGTLDIDNSGAYTLALSTGSLTFQDPSGTAKINVSSANGAAVHTVSANFTISNPLTVTQTSTSTFNISGNILGVGSTLSLTLAGTGTLHLSGAGNTYGGGTIINGGTLLITSDNLGSAGTTVTMGTGTLQLSTGFTTTDRPFTLNGSATIDVVTAVSATLSGIISGTGSLTLTDTGTLTLSNTSNSYSGGTVVSTNGSTLSIASDANLGSSSGTLTLGSSSGTATLSTSSGISSTRHVTLSGNATINTNGNTDSFTGAITGTGPLVITNGGKVILTGSNSYTGGTTLAAASASTLQGDTNGVQGAITANAGTTLDFNQNFNGTYSGVITGSGSLLINGVGGSGTVTFTGSNTPTFTGATQVQGGGLIVNGTLAGGSITLSSGTTLGGTGTVGATTSNSATITPGNGGVGTLTVSGNLTFNGASNVLIHAAPLSASKIAVSGTAVLTGTTLTVSPQPGFYGLTTSYTILTSAGLGGTQFNSPALSTNSNFIPTLSYAGGNNVLLTLKVLNPFFEFPFGNRNEESVGNNIAALNEAGELPAGLASLLGLLVGQSDATINEALDQLHPAPYSAFTEFQEEVGAKLISLFHRKPYLPYVYLDSTRVWVTPFGDSLTEKHHGEEFGFTANSGGVAFGVDGDLTPYWDLGFGGAWNYGQLEWHARHGHGEVNGFYGSVYTDYLVSNFYIGAAVYGGIDFYDTERHIRIVTIDDKAKANFRGYDIVAQLATAYYFGAPTAYFYPYANFDYLYCHTPGFTEHGADSLDLDVGSNHASTFRTEMGLALQLIDLNYDETMGITPLFSIGWVNMCPIERQNYHSFFVGAPIPFTTFGWDETWNLFSLDFGLGFFYQAFSIDVEYNCEMSADKETLLYNHYGNICFEWEW